VYVFDFGDDWHIFAPWDRNASTRLRRSYRTRWPAAVLGWETSRSVPASVERDDGESRKPKDLGCPISRRCGTGGDAYGMTVVEAIFIPCNSPGCPRRQPTRTDRAARPDLSYRFELSVGCGEALTDELGRFGSAGV